MIKEYFILSVICIVACLANIQTDIYTPSIPNIANDLATSLNSVQFTISIFLVAMSLTQLIYGPLSEHYGRKKVLLSGLLIMLFGSIICYSAVKIETLTFGRLIQGFGAGSCATLWRSIFRDLYSGPDIMVKVTFVTLFITFFSPAAPVFGGLIDTYYGWQYNFKFLLAFNFFTFLVILLFLPETNKNIDHKKIKIDKLLATYQLLIKDKQFMSVAAIVFLVYGALFSWIVTSPVFYVEYLSVSPKDFGLLTFVCVATTYTIGGLINNRLSPIYGSKILLISGLTLLGLTACIMMIAYYLIGLEFYSLTFTACLLYFSTSLIWSNSFSIAFKPFGHIAGYAGALYSFFQIGGKLAVVELSLYLLL